MHFRQKSSRKVQRYRRLIAETLEVRRLLAALRVATYNVENNPSNATEDAFFNTILQAIGSESKAGVTRPVDLLVLQETDATSANRIESILDSLYVDEYSRVVSPSYSGDAYGFVYNTATLQLISTANISGPFTRPPLRGHFQPIGDISGQGDFFAYSVHLKADSGGSFESTRAIEAASLRADADALGDGENVLIVGDFNMKNSFEGAYTNLTAAGAGQVSDPVNMPGSWNNNNAFKIVHTQDPSGTLGGMDDRFDLQFISGELNVAGGLDYISTSYRAFGNNGTHTLNQAITTGSGASVPVLSALRDASDHLPVVVDYQFQTATGPGFSLAGNGSVSVSESGLGDSYSIALTSIPTANVVITIDPDANLNLGAGPNIPIVLTFTPANALTPQIVNVTAVDDQVAEGVHFGLITHAVASADPNYSVLSIPNVTPTITDNDIASVLVVQSAGNTNVTEGGTADDFTIALSTIPTSNVTVTITPNIEIDLGAGAGVPVTRLFTPADALIPKTVNVIAFDDTEIEGLHTSTMLLSSTSSDANYNGIVIPSILASITDNDFPPSISLVGEIEEFSGAGTYTIEFFVTANGGSQMVSGFNLPLAFDIPGVTFSGSANDFTPNPAFTTEFVGPLSAPFTADYGVSGSTGPGLFLSSGIPVSLFSISVVASGSASIPSVSEIISVVNSGHDAGFVQFFDAAFEPIPVVNILPGGRLSPPVLPTITNVVVAGSTWGTAFIDAVDGAGVGSGNGLGHALPGANQLRNLPWTSLNRIYIQFSENIGSFTAANMSFAGVNTTNYAGLFTVAYDSGLFRATISMNGPLTADKLLITIPNGAVGDLAGNLLDGEWTDSVSTVSGNGTAGGTFSFRIDALPGDSSNSDTVNAQDIGLINMKSFTVPGVGGYDPMLDLNGTAEINAADVGQANLRSFTSLPGGNPTPPPALLIEPSWNLFAYKRRANFLRENEGRTLLSSAVDVLFCNELWEIPHANQRLL